MRVCAAQMNSTSEIDENIQRAVALIHTAAENGSDLVLLPEFFNMVYFAQYRDYQYLSDAEPIQGNTIRQISEAARSNKVWVVATIFEQQRPGVLYDTAVLIDRQGAVHGAYRKAHPAAVYGLEKIYFRSGSHFPVFDIEGWPTGIMICWDAYFPETARILALHGAELILAPFATPNPHVWRELIAMRAFENGCYLAACNKVGPEGDWTFYGKSMIASPAGEIIAQVTGAGDELIYADLEKEMIFEWRKRFPVFRDRRPELYADITKPMEDL